MSRDDPGSSAPDERQVRRAMLAFAEFVERLDDEGRLLEALPLLLDRLGDLRRILFDYEVRATERLMPVEDEIERESRRVVREAIERYEEMIEEWGSGWTPPEDREADGNEEDDDGDGEGPSS